jgi:predicted Zn-dependent protease with MMP-like domain
MSIAKRLPNRFLDHYSKPFRSVADPISHPHRYAGKMFLVSDERFEELAAEALASLPPSLSSVMENVAVIVEDEAKGRNLFGLYEGVPLTQRGPMSYTGVLPDRITLYQSAICRYCSSEEDVKRQVQKTVIHEVAHHFGISDPRLEELGCA